MQLARSSSRHLLRIKAKRSLGPLTGIIILPPDSGMCVKTTTATVIDKKTAYPVSYDDKTNTPKVSVEKGEVEIS